MPFLDPIAPLAEIALRPGGAPKLSRPYASKPSRTDAGLQFVLSELT